MAPMLFAGIAVRDHAAAVPWYEKFFGRPASFEATETESVWGLAEHGWVYVVERPADAGHALLTIMVDDLDATVADVGDRGIKPERRESYDNGARKVLYQDPDGNEISYAWAPRD
ncbi:VOC family protein [Saccharomonospora piscinae]|uniref:VOC family protein n=1 Tax=Saccharomonospora piscinae TaxID=687388 RepID=UPI000463111D|nr:VOC family protein [Saccharomonospora piscinae]TLW93270.1 VOC family protein [Saccharomonospora piscinae]